MNSDKKIKLICGEEDESEDHLFVDCPFARLILSDIGTWWGVDYNRISQLSNLVERGDIQQFTGKRKMVFIAVVYILTCGKFGRFVMEKSFRVLTAIRNRS